MIDQPAKISYFFGQGYRDLVNTIKEAWRLNLKTAKEKFNSSQENGFFTPTGGVNLVTAICVFIFGTIITT